MITESTLGVHRGDIVLPLYNGIIALASKKYLKFYQWTNHFDQLASVAIEDDDFSDVTVTHDNKLLLRKGKYLRSYSLRYRAEEEKYIVTTRVMECTEREKSWVEKEAIQEPYFIGLLEKDERKMLFYVETKTGVNFIAVDTGILISNYKFWCVIQNRIIFYDKGSIYYFALIGQAKLHKLDAGNAENIYINIVGTTVLMSCPDATYIFWSANTDYDCTIVQTTKSVVLVGDKYAVMDENSMDIFDARNNKINHSADTAKIIRKSEVISTWVPLSTISGSTPMNSSRKCDSGRTPTSARQTTGKIQQCNKTQSESTKPSTDDVMPIVREIKDDMQIDGIPKLLLPPEPVLTRKTSGTIKELVRKKSSKSSITPGNKMLVRDINSDDFKVILIDKI